MQRSNSLRTTGVSEWLYLACLLERILQSSDQLIAGQTTRLALHRYNRLMPGAKRTFGFRSRLWRVSTICLADPLPDLALGRPAQQPVDEFGVLSKNPAESCL